MKISQYCQATIFVFGFSCGLTGAALSPREALEQDLEREYFGRPFPTAEEVLSGEWETAIPPSPDPNVNYDGISFAEDRLTPVPKPGIHPRVILSPEDIERFRYLHAHPEESTEEYRKTFALIEEDALLEREAYYDNQGNLRGNPPWGGSYSPIAGTALYALITENEELGRKAVELTLERVRTEQALTGGRNGEDDPVSTKWDDNAFAWGPAHGLHHSVHVALEYDYAAPFMTEAEKAEVRAYISDWVSDRYSAFMEIPDHFMINNHQSFAMNWLLAAYAIEGEEGSDPRVFPVAEKKITAQLSYAISPMGNYFEQIKPHLHKYAVIAVAKRDRRLLKHSHLIAFAVNMSHSAWYYESTTPNDPMGESRWMIGSAVAEPKVGLGNEIQAYRSGLLHYYYPGVAFAHFNWMLTNNEALNVHQGPDAMLLTASRKSKFPGQDILGNFEADSIPVSILNALPYTHVDFERGLFRTRTGGLKDDMVVRFESRMDMYFAGHEISNMGTFRLSADGTPWIPYPGTYRQQYQRNTVYIDGIPARDRVPIPTTMAGFDETRHGVTIAVDMTDARNWWKEEKAFEFHHGMFESPHYQWLWDKPWNVKRTQELPFHQNIRDFYEGYGHADYGAWHGETRGMERYEQWDNVQQAMRTMHVARGDHPYVIVIDDYRKDDEAHTFDWFLNLMPQAELIEMSDPNQLPLNMTFSRPGGNQHLLVSILQRDTQDWPMRMSKEILPTYNNKGDLTTGVLRVSATAVEPHFMVLIYPYREGVDPVPQLTWNQDMSDLDVAFPGQTDTYSFLHVENGRTLFTLQRNGEPIHRTKAVPPKPRLAGEELWYGKRMAGVGGNEHSTPDELRDFVFPFHKKTTVRFEEPGVGQEIRYTTDGSEPAAESLLYQGPIALDASTILKARIVDPNWPFSDNKAGSVFEASYVRQDPLPGVSGNPKMDEPGLTLKVYEVYNTYFDADGYYSGEKEMLLDVSSREPIFSASVAGIAVPKVSPLGLTTMPDPKFWDSKNELHPNPIQTWGYYEYTGYFYADQTGTHRFKLNSPGPVVLELGGEPVIRQPGPYYLSQRDRYGALALREGWHAFRLLVADPVFWKDGKEPDGPLQIRMDVLNPAAQSYMPVDAAQFSASGSGH